MLHPAFFDQLDHPARIQINTKTNPTAHLSQMLDRQPQTTRARRTQHQPVTALRKVLIRQRLAKQRVVRSEVIHDHSAFGNTGRTTGFKNVSRAICMILHPPSLNRTTAKPIIFKCRKLFQIVIALDFCQRVEFQFCFLTQPKRAASGFMKMTLHDLVSVLIELIFCLFDGGGERIFVRHIGIKLESLLRLSLFHRDISESVNREPSITFNRRKSQLLAGKT